MLKESIRIGIFCTVLALGGCAAFRGSPQRLPNSPEALKQLDPYYETTIAAYYASLSDREAAAVRNRFIETRLGVIDAQYLAFKQNLYQEGVSANVAVDIATLGLSSAATLVPAASTKSILSAVSGGLIGSRAAAEKNLYFEKTMPALLAQMEALRKKVRLRILQNMTLDAEKYPLSQAEFDLQDYYTAGSIPGAIVGITDQAVKAETNASDELNGLTAPAIKKKLEAKGFDVASFAPDEASALLSGFWKPGGAVNTANANEINKWLSGNNIKASVPFFVQSDRYSAERVRAVEEFMKKGLIKR